MGLQSLRMGVQNGGARFAGVESETSEKSEKSMEPENTSQSSQASRYSQTHCAGMVSQMRVTGVQNVGVDPQMTQMIKTKKISLCLANSRVSPATAGCLCG